MDDEKRGLHVLTPAIQCKAISQQSQIARPSPSLSKRYPAHCVVRLRSIGKLNICPGNGLNINTKHMTKNRSEKKTPARRGGPFNLGNVPPIREPWPLPPCPPPLCPPPPLACPPPE